MTTTTTPRTTTTVTSIAARPARARLQMRWTLNGTPGSAPTLSARWAVADSAAPQQPLAA